MSKEEDILQQLKKHKSLTHLELELLNNIPYNSVRARISNLRKKGIDIKYDMVETGKYILSEDYQLLNYLAKNRLFNREISIKKVAKELSVKEDDLKLLVSKLFDRYDIIQLSPDRVIIKN